MNGKQHAVLWLGLTLILVRIFTSDQWHNLYALFTTNVKVASQSGQAATTAQSGSPDNGTKRRSHG
jgi:hypothetical protein